MHYMKNKKSQSIAILLLVILTLAVCGVAILSFLYSDYKQTKQTLLTTSFIDFYYQQSNFEYFIYFIAEDTLRVMLKHLQPSQITSSDFLNRFQINYRSYTKVSSFPKEFGVLEIVNQIGDVNNYDIKIDKDVLKFNLLDLNFSQNYSADKSAGLKNITLVKSIKFEIPLKTLIPY